MQKAAYQYNCVNCGDLLTELEYLMEHAQPISYEQFCEHIEPDDLERFKENWGYSEEGLTLKDDWHLTYEKSNTKNGRDAWLLTHSAIEYVFMKK